MKTVERLFLALAVAATVGGGPALAQSKSVTVGYQGNYQPWKVAIADGEFAKATGYDINWRQFDSGSKVITAMASGDVDVAMSGSSPIAAAVSRGLNMKLFYIVQGIGESEALVVKKEENINEVEDLKGKTIGVPFVSTTHYHMMFALDHWNIKTSDLELINMQPNQAAAAWERGDIDGAFVWNPALQRMKNSGGKVLITSGKLCKLGKCTFNGMVVKPDFAESNPEFMTQFVAILDKYSMMYRHHPKEWTPDSNLVQKIVDVVGGNPDDVPTVLSQYVFPSLAEQASDQWLGAGADGGAAFALKDTAKFLKKQKKVDTVPMDIAQYVTNRWVEAAMNK